jgi:hypothetical protein
MTQCHGVAGPGFSAALSGRFGNAVSSIASVISLACLLGAAAGWAAASPRGTTRFAISTASAVELGGGPPCLVW